MLQKPAPRAYSFLSVFFIFIFEGGASAVYESIDEDRANNNDSKQHTYINEPGDLTTSEENQSGADYIAPVPGSQSQPYEEITTPDDRDPTAIPRTGSSGARSAKHPSSNWRPDMKTITIIILAILMVVFFVLTVYFGTKSGSDDVDLSPNNHEPSILTMRRDEKFTLWGNWESCSACYGVGTQQRFRFCTEEEMVDVSFCPLGWIKETQDCQNNDIDECPAFTSRWSPWAPCNCTNGEQFRIRFCTATERQNTSFCLEGSLKETKKCNTQCPSASVCYGEYTILSESYRRESVPGRNPYNCDRDKVHGNTWYRFQLPTGENGILDHCPRYWTCGTAYPLWMNGTHPTQYGVIKYVQIAGSTKGESRNNCKQWSGTASVTRCAVNGDVFSSTNCGDHLAATCHIVHANTICEN